MDLFIHRHEFIAAGQRLEGEVAPRLSGAPHLLLFRGYRGNGVYNDFEVRDRRRGGDTVARISDDLVAGIGHRAGLIVELPDFCDAEGGGEK